MDVTTDQLAIIQRNLATLQATGACQPLALDCSRRLPRVDFLMSMFTPVNDQYAPHALSIARMQPDGLTIDTTYAGRGFVSSQSGGLVAQLYDSNRIALPGELTPPFAGGRWQGFIKLAGFNPLGVSHISLIVQDSANREIQGSGFVVEWVLR